MHDELGILAASAYPMVMVSGTVNTPPSPPILKSLVFFTKYPQRESVNLPGSPLHGASLSCEFLCICFVDSSQAPSLAKGEQEDRRTEVVYSDHKAALTKNAEVTNHRVVHMEEVVNKAGDLR